MTTSSFFWVPFEILINFFQGFVFIWFPNNILTKRKPERISSCIFAVIIACLSSIYSFAESLSIQMAFSDGWIYLVLIIYCAFFFKERFFSKIFWSVFLITLVDTFSVFGYMLFFVLTDVDFSILLERNLYRLFSVLFVNASIFIAIKLIVAYFKKSKDDYLPGKPLFFLVVINLLCYLISSKMFDLYVSGTVTKSIFASGCVVAFLITVLAVIMYRILCNSAAEEYALKYQLSLQESIENRMVEINSMYTSLNQLQHDINKHIQITEDLLAEGNIEEGRNYLNQVERQMVKLFATGCLSLDSALTVKQQAMEAAKIDFQYELCDLQTIPLPESDFCSIILNLLDNAMFGVEECHDILRPRFIRLSIRRVKQMLFIECINPCVYEMLPITMGQNISTKRPSGTAMGLTIIKSIVSKIDGTFEMNQDNGFFTVKIALAYPLNTEVHNETSS